MVRGGAWSQVTALRGLAAGKVAGRLLKCRLDPISQPAAGLRRAEPAHRLVHVLPLFPHGGLRTSAAHCLELRAPEVIEAGPAYESLGRIPMSVLTSGSSHVVPVKGPRHRRSRRASAAWRWPCLGLALFTALAGPQARALAGAAGASAIASVSVSKPFFNPTMRQKIAIQVAAEKPGSLNVLILDRDGYLVRKLVSDQPVETETLWYQWDGRDDGGQVVPDEAYSLKIDLRGPGFAHSYFPASAPPNEVKADFTGYDRLTGAFSYKLAAPARVHVQAGMSRVDPKTKERDGPVLKTLANRAPRPRGAVVETWSGLDETDSYFVPDLPDFAVAIAATSLPENAIIAVGNSSRSFLEAVGTRRGESLVKAAPAGDHSHHRGLTTLDDVAPTLRVAPANARWSEAEKVWTVASTRLSGSVSLDGPSSGRFAAQPAELVIFVNERRMSANPKPVDGGKFQVELGDLTPGEHIVAFNWASRYGPVAVSSFRVRVPARADSTGRPDAATVRGGNR